MVTIELPSRPALRSNASVALNRRGAVVTLLFVEAVMQQDVRAPTLLSRAGEACGKLAQDALGANGFPVIALHIPLHGNEVFAAQEAEDTRPASAEGRAKEVYRDAQGVFEQGVAVADFARDERHRLGREKRMRHRVIADEMSGRMNAAHKIWMLPDEFPDHEEGGPGVIAGQQVQQRGGGFRVGAIVVGEGPLLGVATANEGPAKELRLGLETGADQPVGDG